MKSFKELSWECIEILLQAGLSGSSGGKQVESLAAGSLAQALGGLTKQHFHGQRRNITGSQRGNCL